MRQLGAHKALFCNVCIDLFCTDVYFCVSALFFVTNNIFCRGPVVCGLVCVDAKTVLKRRVLSEKANVRGCTISTFSVFSVM